MAKNQDLLKAKQEKNDEFYTQWSDIEIEINAYLDYDKDTFKGKTILCPCDDPSWSNFTKFFATNFEKLGLKKLICTSYAYDSKKIDIPYEKDGLEAFYENYDETISKAKGKIYTLDHDITGDGKINFDDIEWHYLNGDGDFRSDEVKALRDEADIIITNPPFSLFREFLAWIIEANKKFIIIGNIGAIGYKEIFPFVKNNKIWLGVSIHSGDREFRVPQSYPLKAANFRVDENGDKFIRVKGVRWFTNVEHGRRHQPLKLSTMADNIKYNKKLNGKDYLKYDNYDAIEVPETKAIPSDYDGVMGVPSTFLDNYCPEQFEILGQGTGDNAKLLGITKNYRGRTDLAITIDGRSFCPYQRILIRRKK